MSAAMPLEWLAPPPPTDPAKEACAFFLLELGRLETPTLNYALDPLAFARDVVGVEPWGPQQDILRALIPARARVSVRSGHKVGKSNVATLAALWFYSSFPDARVVMTAPTARQVQAILWRELRKLHARAKQPIPGDMHERAHSGLKGPDFREVVGYTAKDPEAMAGTSGAAILYIVDEASGVSEAIFEAIEGNRAAGARLLLLGNPTRTAGEFFLSHTKKRAFYTAIHVSSEDTPNCTGKGAAIPGLASPEWVREKREEWGEDSPLFQVRVRGNFPSADPYAVIGIALLTEAEERGRELAALDAEPGPTDLDLAAYDGPLELGVDPARFGDDDTAVVPRRGQRIFPLRLVHGMDTVQIAGLVLAAVRELARPGEMGVRIKVDVIGIGAGVVDALAHSPLAAEGLIVVVPVNSASASSVPAEYPNLRSQLLFDVAAWLKAGGALPPGDDRLAQELTEPRYAIDGRGRRVVEAKDEVKKRIGRSPDRADAVALAVYSLPVAAPAVAPPPPRTFNFDAEGLGF